MMRAVALFLPLTLLSALCHADPTTDAKLVVIPSTHCCNQQPSTLEVTGQGSAKYSTTMSRVHLSVKVTGTATQSSAEVQRLVAIRATAVVDVLKAFNVSELQTTSVSLTVIYRYPTGQERQAVGYEGDLSISYLVENARSGAILDAAVAAGSPSVGIDSVTFEATREDVETARDRALSRATKDALKKADIILSTMDLVRRPPVSVTVGYTTPLPAEMPHMRGMAFMAAADMAQPTTPVIGGENEVTALVTLRFAYATK